jgi:hypothetical protein
MRCLLAIVISHVLQILHNPELGRQQYIGYYPCSAADNFSTYCAVSTAHVVVTVLLRICI